MNRAIDTQDQIFVNCANNSYSKPKAHLKANKLDTDMFFFLSKFESHVLSHLIFMFFRHPINLDQNYQLVYRYNNN